MTEILIVVRGPAEVGPYGKTGGQWRDVSRGRTYGLPPVRSFSRQSN